MLLRCEKQIRVATTAVQVGSTLVNISSVGLSIMLSGVFGLSNRGHSGAYR